MFEITGGKGFKITFQNGVTVSVQSGSMNYCLNYCQNRAKKIEMPLSEFEGGTKSVDAEIAMFKDGEIISQKCPFIPSGDDVLGWVSPEEVLKILNWAANYKG